jgi:hypothetical protein
MLSSVQKLCSRPTGPTVRSFSSVFQRALNQPLSSLRNAFLPTRSIKSIAAAQRSYGHLGLSDHSRQGQHPSSPVTIGWAHVEPRPSGPIIVGWMEMEEEEEEAPLPMEAMNRNTRRGKRANRGKRPVSRARRRTNRRAFGNHRR